MSKLNCIDSGEHQIHETECSVCGDTFCTSCSMHDAVCDKCLTPFKSLLKAGEKINVNVVSGKIGSVVAYVDDYVRNPGDFKKGNYFRFLKTSSNLTAALG